MKKKIIITVVVLLAIFTCVDISGNSEKARTESRLYEVYDEINQVYRDESYLLDKILLVWSVALTDNKDHEGYFCSDFNDALRKYYISKEYAKKEQSISSKRDKIQMFFGDPQKFPDEYVDAIEDIGELWMITDQMYSLAKEPRGSLLTFDAEVDLLRKKFKEKKSLCEIKYAQKIKKWKKSYNKNK